MEKTKSVIIHCADHDCVNNSEGNCRLKEIRVDTLGSCLDYEDTEDDD